MRHYGQSGKTRTSHKREHRPSKKDSHPCYWPYPVLTQKKNGKWVTVNSHYEEAHKDDLNE